MKNSERGIFLMSGGVLTLVGTVFTAVGCWMLANIDYVYEHGTGDVGALPYVFALIGLLLLAGGISLLYVSGAKTRMDKRLIEKGEYVTAEITGVAPNYNVRINRGPTYQVLCSYYDQPTDTMHVFRSRNLLFDPTGHMRETTVRVYVNKENRDFTHYYVDVDAVLPEMRIH